MSTMTGEASFLYPWRFVHNEYIQMVNILRLIRIMHFGQSQTILWNEDKYLLSIDSVLPQLPSNMRIKLINQSTNRYWYFVNESSSQIKVDSASLAIYLCEKPFNREWKIRDKATISLGEEIVTLENNNKSYTISYNLKEMEDEPKSIHSISEVEENLENSFIKERKLQAQNNQQVLEKTIIEELYSHASSHVEDETPQSIIIKQLTINGNVNHQQISILTVEGKDQNLERKIKSKGERIFQNICVLYKKTKTAILIKLNHKNHECYSFYGKKELKKCQSSIYSNNGQYQGYTTLKISPYNSIDTQTQQLLPPLSQVSSVKGKLPKDLKKQSSSQQFLKLESIVVPEVKTRLKTIKQFNLKITPSTDQKSKGSKSIAKTEVGENMRDKINLKIMSVSVKISSSGSKFMQMRVGDSSPYKTQKSQQKGFHSWVTTGCFYENASVFSFLHLLLYNGRSASLEGQAKICLLQLMNDQNCLIQQYDDYIRNAQQQPLGKVAITYEFKDFKRSFLLSSLPINESSVAKEQTRLMPVSIRSSKKPKLRVKSQQYGQ